MPDLNPTVIGAIISAVAVLIAAAISTWRKSNAGTGHHLNAAHNSGPVNQQIIDQSTKFIVERPAPAPTATAPTVSSSTSADYEADSLAMMLLCAGAALVGVWCMATYWSQIALGVTCVVGACLVLTAWSWLPWRTLATSTRVLAALIVGLSAAVSWAVFVIPTGFGKVPSLPALALTTASHGGGLRAMVPNLTPETLEAYVLRLIGLVLLLFLLVSTSVEAWGMSLLTAEAARSEPRAWVLRLGTRLASVFAVNGSALTGLAFLAALALVIIHPVSLSWILQHINPGKS